MSFTQVVLLSNWLFIFNALGFIYMLKTIGLIGPGIMGLPMGMNLLKAGYSLFVYARRKEATQPLLDAGATFCESPAVLAGQVDTIISIVSDTADVEEVLLGDQGVIQRAKSNTLVIDMSTISPLVTRDIAKQLAVKGIRMLDAPVSGGEAGAIAGTLTIMVGGSSDDLQRAMPALNVLGETITHIGEQGAGQVAKACNQTLVAQTMVAVSEAFNLAKAAGVDPAKVREALLGGFANSKILESHGQRMLQGDYEPGFKAGLHHKDINIVRDTIQQLNLNLTGTQLAASYLDALIEQNAHDSDSAMVHELISAKNT
jgi:2-hydroxy-3-oxopropionate reductase